MLTEYLQNIPIPVTMKQSKMIFTIEELTSTPKAKPHPTIFRVITPNVSRIAWNDGSPSDHNQSDIISLDCTSLLERTQNILDIEDSYESSVVETTDECTTRCSLASQVLNKGFVEHIQQQVNDKLRSEEHKEYRRKEQTLFQLRKCFVDCIQTNHEKLHKTTMKKVLTKISQCITGKRPTNVNADRRSKAALVFYPVVSTQSPHIVDISKELGLLNGNTFLKEGMKCTWC